MILLPFRASDVDGNYGICPQCGADRVRVSSGAVCPQGHGRIVPVCVHYGAFVKSLPKAQRLGKTRRWKLTGLRGEFRTAVIRPGRSTWLAQRSTLGDLPPAVTFGRRKSGFMAFKRIEKEASR